MSKKENYHKNNYSKNNQNCQKRSLESKAQQLNGLSTDFGQLLKTIRDRSLTESLEILERYGIREEQALNFIAKFKQIDWSQSPYSEEVAL